MFALKYSIRSCLDCRITVAGSKPRGSDRLSILGQPSFSRYDGQAKDERSNGVPRANPIKRHLSCSGVVTRMMNKPDAD
jgi:hypothetical protein